MKHIKLFEQFEDDPFGEETPLDDNEIKVGDRVKCINNFVTGLEKNGIYNVVRIVKNRQGDIFLIVNDNTCHYLISRFEKMR